MNGKFFLYILVGIIVIWSLDSIQINKIFKKNHILQARVFYFLLAIALIELVTSFFYELYIAAKFL